MSQEQSTAGQTDAWTIKRLLDWTAEYFDKSGSDSPRLAAEILLAEALGCQRIELYTRFDEVPGQEPVTTFRGWVKRHAEGEPVAYLVGHREFYSLRFTVNQHVLIPRPETEHVVVAAIEAAKMLDEGRPRIVDIGTGSGCIIVALAKHIQEASFGATDISADAIEVAKANAESNEVVDRIRFLNCDLLEKIESPVHIVVSNPPYIGTEERGTVEENVRKFEPDVALFSGSDGTEATARLIEQAADKLADGGFLIFETSPFIADRCRDLVNATGVLKVEKTVRDLGGHQRVIVARKG
ncbi:MAG: peptide chain release factor N(5)-glutamine methyltransferase [Planctomycetota bacterium]